MAQIAKLEMQAEIKSSTDKFFDLFSNKMYLLPKICPQEFKDGKLVQGDWNSVGSVRVWTYAAGGNAEIGRETIEVIDDKSKTITLNVFEGDVKKYYKTFKPTLNIPASDQGNLVKWTVEFEKQNESIPDPIKYMDFLTRLTMNMDAYLLNA